MQVGFEQDATPAAQACTTGGRGVHAAQQDRYVSLSNNTLNVGDIYGDELCANRDIHDDSILCMRL